MTGLSIQPARRRICFFLGDLSRTGGTERVTTVIASAMAERGWDVSILSMSRGECSGFPLSPAVRLSSLHMEGRSANFSDFAIWRALRRFLTTNAIHFLIDVDVVLSWYSIPAAWGVNTKIVSWEHFHCANNTGDLGQKLRRCLGRRLAVRKSHAVVTLTERDRSQYQSKLQCVRPVLAIPNPITIEQRGLKSCGGNVVLAAGRMVDQKGFDLLLDAWANIASTATDWRLRIVGDGPNEGALRSQARILGIEESVEFVGRRTAMGDEYRNASIYAMSSRFEGLPLVLIEAKASGLPIVSFDCACGPSDIVRDGIDGDLVPAEDVRSLSNALLALILDDARREQYASAAVLDERFRLEPIVERWVSLLTAPGGCDEAV